MKSYDDLQRFKEKTQTNHIEFKDMSELSRNSDNSNWAIIKQLMDDGSGSALGNGQSVRVAAPQPIAGDLFSRPATVSAPRPVSTPSPLQDISAQLAIVETFVAAKSVAQFEGSLLDSISASLKPAQPAELPRFNQLFSAVQQQPDTSLSKDTPLQPLLERIASCR